MLKKRIDVSQLMSILFLVVQAIFCFRFVQVINPIFLNQCINECCCKQSSQKRESLIESGIYHALKINVLESYE